MSNFAIVFVHGYEASSKANWYPRISKELDKYEIEYFIPDLPGGNSPHAVEWLREIHKIINEINKPLILFGHSLGTRAVLLYLEKYSVKVSEVFLLSSFSNDINNGERRNEHYKDFFDHELDLDKIKSNADKFIVIHSKNDPDIDFEEGLSISRELDAEFIEFENKEHFTEPEDYIEILNILKKELGF